MVSASRPSPALRVSVPAQRLVRRAGPSPRLARFRLIGLLLCLWGAGSVPVGAQVSDTLTFTLPDVEIEATRATATTGTAPFALTLIQRPPESMAVEPALSLESLLRDVPGVWINDRGHLALGERLVVRGMGWRAAFGVRGVQAVLDGIPLTTPDGQAVLDIVDPAFVQRAEMIRGPASLYWGNAGGGVLYLSTRPPADTVTVRLRALSGSYGLQQGSGSVRLTPGRHRLYAYASDTRRDGYRRHSSGRFSRFGVHADVDLGPLARLVLTAAGADQDTRHPGSLTHEQVLNDPRQADPRYSDTSAGKESLQLQAGGTLYLDLPAGLLSSTAYGSMRRLDNPLPFAYIDLDRKVGGLRLQFQPRLPRLGLDLGVDLARQRDDRLNLDNVAGHPGTDRQLDQQETVDQRAAYAYVTYPVLGGAALHAGLRIDAVRFQNRDRLPENGDQSGERTFLAWTPGFGLSYRVGPVLLYGNYSSAFETPTTTELVNRPDADGGFNPEIDPQRTRGVEIGVRHDSSRIPLGIDAALFYLRISDQLIPFQSEDGRTYFANAGRNTHQGIELALSARPTTALHVHLAYTGSHFVFDNTETADRRVPGVPAHHLAMNLRWLRHGWYAEASFQVVGSTYADNANETSNDGYALLDLTGGHTGYSLGRLRVQPFVRIGNVTDTRYSGSLSINAFGGRYFEPSPGRTLAIGLNLAH